MLTVLGRIFQSLKLVFCYEMGRHETRRSSLSAMLHRRGEGGFGSNVEGIKPIIFDVGKDERWKGGKSEEALKECHKQLGDNATIIYDDPNREPIEK